MAHASTKAVLTAIFANGTLTVLKFFASLASGSASMTNEAIHSLMDTLNQICLLLGLRESERAPDKQYAFGHGQKKYLWNLWSAIGLFSIGCGLGLSHAYHSWHEIGTTEFVPTEQKILVFAIGVLAFGIVLEGYSLYVATKEYLARMRADGHDNPISYFLYCEDPTLVAVMLEDTVAMLGLIFAIAGILMTALTHDPIWDVGFSTVIALMLGGVAFYLGYINMRYLTDIRDPAAERTFSEVADEHPEVERYHDLRSIAVDENHTVVVAEIELREEAMMVGLRERIDETRDAILRSVPESRQHDDNVMDYVADRAAVQATLERTEQIIEEIVRDARARNPRISHITIEVEGIAT
ncbi:MAG: cation diffusion facilitator family transporter [Pseudomonadota bacterium]